MLRRLFGLVFVIIVTGAIASFLNSQGGYTIIEWMGWRIEARTSLLIAIAGGFMIIVIAFDRFVGMLIGLPDRISGRIAERRQEQGHHAVALGLVAASAGDAREAQRQAKKATKLMGNSTLTELLSAQAAGLNGDHAAAVTFFEKLSRQRETAFFGKAGLMRLHAEEGRTEEALSTGREALYLNQNTPELAKALMALETRHQNWDEALAALKVASRDNAMERDDYANLEAVLHFKKGEAQQSEDVSSDQVIKSLEMAHKADPRFIPAALTLAALYEEHGKARKINTVLKRSFAACSHPDLAMALYERWSGGNQQDADALTKLIRLIDKHGNDHACLIAAARLSMQLSLWGEALRLIMIIPAEERNIVAWQVLADLAEHAPETPQDDWPDRTEALVSAASAKHPHGWVCQTCQTTHPEWIALCSSCDGFATMRWQ